VQSAKIREEKGMVEGRGGEINEERDGEGRGKSLPT